MKFVGLFGTVDDVGSEIGSMVIDPDGIGGNGDEFFFRPNIAPDEGLASPFNSWMTLFGQFFDHGLDFIKRGEDKVYIPLQPDDPLYVSGSPTNFMAISRTLVNAGDDGILGTNDPNEVGALNQTSPQVDQNQTYTSHPSAQIFVREYVAGPNGPVATGALIEGSGGGMATWGEVKAQAANILGIELTDLEVLDIPLFAVDQYGEFLRGHWHADDFW